MFSGCAIVGAFESLDVGLSAAAQWLNNDDRLGKYWNTIFQQMRTMISAMFWQKFGSAVWMTGCFCLPATHQWTGCMYVLGCNTD